MNSRFRVPLLLAVAVFLPSWMQAATVNATWNSATDVPVTASGYTASGTVNFTLNCALPTGANLTVVNNTSLNFIQGTFSNLAQGQKVSLTYHGVTCNFVANYYGGTGNDLVLQWIDRRLVAWGDDSYGELGDGMGGHIGVSVQSSVPVPVNMTGALAGKTVLATSQGGGFTLALCTDGTVVSWGYNNFGELGNGSNSTSVVPVAVDTSGALAGKFVVAISAGAEHALALCSDGTVVAWGDNGYGELGSTVNELSESPVAVNNASGSALYGKTVVAIAAGEGHSLALCSDGTLAAWGDNAYGQLGNGGSPAPYEVNVPVSVTIAGTPLAGKTIRTIAAGEYFNLVLCTDGTLATWGYNYNGELGNGNAGNNTNSPVPTAVNTASGSALFGKTVTAIAVGGEHSIALCSDGSLAAWGYAQDGALGNGMPYSYAYIPLSVNQTGVLSGKTVIQLGAGGSSGAALCSDGTLTTWGNLSPSGTGTSLPTVVSASPLTAGERYDSPNSGNTAAHYLAFIDKPSIPQIIVQQPSGTSLTSGVSLVDFGNSPVGTGVPLSFALLNTGLAPLTITGVTIDGTNAADFAVTTAPASSVAAGASTSFVVTFKPAALFGGGAFLHIRSSDPNTGTFTISLVGESPGTLAATFNSATSVPLTIGSFTGTGSKVNFSLNCALATGTNLRVVNNTGLPFIRGAFGNLAQGQQVSLTYNGVTYNFVANYYGGTGNDLVLQWAGVRPLSWGYNSNGQLGNDGTANSSVPGPVDTSGVLAGKTIIALAAGSYHTLALCSDGTVAAWGDNQFGELGNNSTTNSSAPVAVDTSGVLAGKSVVAISAGDKFSLALCSDGSVVGWGFNSYSQLGTTQNTGVVLGSDEISNVPVAMQTAGTVLAGKVVVAIAAGASHSLALCSDGTVAIWGDYTGQPINPSQNPVPLAVNASAGSALFGKTVVALAAGQGHNLALCSDGTVAAWGSNDYGQLGNNSSTDSAIPVAVDAAQDSALFGKTVTAVSGGGVSSMALCSNGTVAAWGGLLGNNTGNTSSVPVAVDISQDSALFGKTVTSVSEGRYHCLARCSDGTVEAWGYNSFGELGDNSTATSLAPVSVSTASLAPGEVFTNAFTGSSAQHSLALLAEPPPPATGTLLATSITSTGATLNGAFNPNGATTTAYFQYGTSTSYGSNTGYSFLGSGFTVVQVSFNTVGLAKGTTYHYRLVTNSGGTITYGADQTFTTAAVNTPAWHSAQVTALTNPNLNNMADGFRTGAAHNSWNLYYYKGTDNNIWCVSWNGAQWVQQPLANSGDVSDWLSFGTVYNLCCYQNKANRLACVYFNGSAWISTPLPNIYESISLVSGPGWSPGDTIGNVAGDIVIDQAWNIIYYRGNDGQLYAEQWNGKTWGATPLGGVGTVKGSVAVDQVSHLIYYQGTDNQLWCYQWTGKIWQQVKLSTTANVGGSVAADRNGLMAYYRSSVDNSAWAVYWNGKMWAQLQLNAQASMSSSATSSSGIAPYTQQYDTLYLDNNGQCRALYWSGAAWVHALLGDGAASLTGGLSLQPTAHWAFARRADGNVVVFYYQ